MDEDQEMGKGNDHGIMDDRCTHKRRQSTSIMHFKILQITVLLLLLLLLVLLLVLLLLVAAVKERQQLPLPRVRAQAWHNALQFRTRARAGIN